MTLQKAQIASQNVKKCAVLYLNMVLSYVEKHMVRQTCTWKQTAVIRREVPGEMTHECGNAEALSSIKSQGPSPRSPPLHKQCCLLTSKDNRWTIWKSLFLYIYDYFYPLVNAQLVYC